MITNTITIKRVDLTGIESLIEIGKQTFYETFAQSNTEADMQNYLYDNFSIDKIKSELTQPQSFFYFAISEGEVVGYSKLNVGEAQTEKQNANSLEIERIYVLKEFHGKQVGAMLLEHAIQMAKQKHAEYLWLGVWERNERAINFYTKHHFVAFDKHIFQLGSDAQTDILMKLML